MTVYVPVNPNLVDRTPDQTGTVDPGLVVQDAPIWVDAEVVYPGRGKGAVPADDLETAPVEQAQP